MDFAGIELSSVPIGKAFLGRVIGFLCVQALRLGIRVSGVCAFALYNTSADIDALAATGSSVGAIHCSVEASFHVERSTLRGHLEKAHAQICRDEEILALSGKLEMEHYFYPFGAVPMRIVLP